MPNGNSTIQGSINTYTPAESLPVQNMTSPGLEGATLVTEEVQLAPIEVLEDTFVETLEAPASTANTEAYTIDTSFVTNPHSDTAPTFGRHDTSGNTTYQMSDEDLRKVVYVVNHESNGTYEDALGVISVILNRIEDGRFNASTPLEVVTAPNQFEVWSDEKANAFTLEQANPNVLQAVQDATLGGIRNNDYVEFKASYSKDYTKGGELKHQLVEGGNKYHHLAKHLNRYDVVTPDSSSTQTPNAF